MNKRETEFNNYFDERNDGNLLFLTPKVDLLLPNSESYDYLCRKLQIGDNISELILDLSLVKNYDTYLLLLINFFGQTSESKKIKFRLVNSDEKINKFLDTFTFSADFNSPKIQPTFVRRFFTHTGEEAKNTFNDFKQLIEFFGDLTLKFMVLFIHPRRMRWKDFPFHFTRSGVNAVFICLLILTLLGLITGYQGAVQLRQFGADKFLADLVGISIVRELSPLMIAILVAGRSGSAFAAEIGTMKVSEEIDALKSMGFDIMHFLVLPRVLSVAVAMPILTIFGNIAGIGGGLVAGLAVLDITISGFLNELQKALTFGDLFSGLGKSIIFGILIASVGCFRGLQVHGGAESVGKYTTISVVTGILLIILADAVFTFLFQALGI